MFNRFLVSLVLVFSLMLPQAATAAFSNLVSFGDSLSDNGISNYPVLDDQGFTRFSNGYVWVDYLASNLGIAHDGRAWGGATTGSDRPIDLINQVQAYSGGSADTLYTLWAGGNDLRALLDPTSGLDPAGVITTAMNNIGTAISMLYGQGARHILVPNMVDIGISPEAILNGPAAVAGATYLSMEFNNALKGTLSWLPTQGMGDLIIYEMDVFNFVNNEIMLESGEFSDQFTNKTDAWAQFVEGIGWIPFDSTEDPDNYLFFDDHHPTESAHWLLADLAVNTIPVPGAFLLLGSGLLFITGYRRKN